MSLDSPFLVYGLISLNSLPQQGAVVYVQDITNSSAILDTTTDTNGQYTIDIMDIADDGDTIHVWCDLGSTDDYFVVNIAGTMEEIDLSFAIGLYFSLSQAPTTKNLYLYPITDYHSCCTAFGATDNYDCVNDSYDIPDDDNTYVWHNRYSVCTDMYTLENHTVETGTINYVRVYARAKTHLYTQSSTGSYRILCNHSGTTSRTADINLTTDYNTYYNTLTSTPSGGAWNWTAIDNLRIGFDCSSPTVGGFTANVTLRPSAASVTSLTPSTTPNYACVDDTALDTSDYVYVNGAGWVYDLYELQDHGGVSGTINHVNVCGYFGTYGYSSGCGAYVNFAIKNPASAVSYYTPAGNCLGGGTPYLLWSLNHNYDTGLAWTWAEVDDLTIGPKLYCIPGTGQCRCYQLYLTVNYNAWVSPEVRTTQVYAMVNYTPSSEMCLLNQPTRYNISNTRKVSILQPERGDRLVYDLSRDTKILTMNGIEYDTATSTATSRLLCVRNQKDNGTYITISGVGDTKIDTTWLIRDFTYDRDAMNQRIWNWMLTAEKYESG